MFALAEHAFAMLQFTHAQHAHKSKRPGRRYKHRPGPSPDGATHRMTSAHFDAPASSTPRHAAASASHDVAPSGIAGRVVRLIWLTARLTRRESVNLHEYQHRFGRSVRSFRRDIAALRDAGLYIDAQPNDFRMTCFVSDSDAA